MQPIALFRASPTGAKGSISGADGDRMRRTLTTLGAVVTALALAQVHPTSASAASFKLRYSTGFGGAAPSHRVWTIYNGKPRCCSSRWAPSQVSNRNGHLRLTAYHSSGGWLSGGLSMGRSLNQTYGAWSIRFRMDRGVGVKMCALLWPDRGWPPEIDFAENSSADAMRRLITSTLHYGSRNVMIHNRHSLNYGTQWHTMGVRWTPHRLSFRMDGRPWATVTSHVPDRPMHLGIQETVGLSNGHGSGPDSTTPKRVRLWIDWVKVWRYIP
jgi:Glycosyl hydrolases family 16